MTTSRNAVRQPSRKSGTICSVLFVDDERQVLASMRLALRREPFDLSTATSAAEALDLLSERQFDVVVSDEQMPEMCGSRFLALVRQLHPNTMRITLTGQASLEAAVRAINEGEIYRFLTKPCDPGVLAQTIRQALQLKRLLIHGRQLVLKSRAQQRALNRLERDHPGISTVLRDRSGAILLDDDDALDPERLAQEIEAALCS